eukprot:2427024-Rhodomonas_salina.1
MRSLVLPHVSCRIESRGARSPGRGAAEGSARSCNALHLLKLAAANARSAPHTAQRKQRTMAGVLREWEGAVLEGP